MWSTWEWRGGRSRWRVDLAEAGIAGALNRALVNAGLEVLELGPERLGLEAVFLRLIGGEDPTAEKGEV